MFKSKLSLLTSLFVIISIKVTAQSSNPKGWNFGSNPDIAKSKNALYTDLLKEKKYSDASKPLYWLLQNTPDLNKSLYINGIKIYESLVSQEKANPARKKQLQDSVLQLYDLRIKYFGKEGYVLNRKGIRFYQYYKTDTTRYGELLATYDKIFKLNPLEKISPNNTVAYMDIIYKSRKTSHKFSEEEVIEKYDLFNETLDIQKKTSKKPENLAKYRKTIDALFTALVKIDCDFIRDKLAPRLKNDLSNVKLAKSIVGFSLKAKCLDLPITLTAAEIVNEATPDYGVSLLIAMKSKANKDYEKSTEFFNKALTLTDDDEKKADIHIHLGDLLAIKGNRPSARVEYQKALALKPGLGKAYTKIGDLYFSSFNVCAKKNNYLEDRGVYLAAYKYYKLAGATKAMEKAKEQFPTSEDIFQQEKAVGDKMTVGCWLNETVTIMKR